MIRCEVGGTPTSIGETSDGDGRFAHGKKEDGRPGEFGDPKIYQDGDRWTDKIIDIG